MHFGGTVKINLLIRTLEYRDTCIIYTLSYGPKWCFSEKSGHLDNQDTYNWFQDVHNTQVPQYSNFATVQFIVSYANYLVAHSVHLSP